MNAAQHVDHQQRRDGYNCTRTGVLACFFGSNRISAVLKDMLVCRAASNLAQNTAQTITSDCPDL